MSKRCNKCGQGDPHLADTWCLGCTALEALSGELRLAWGQAGTRALAQDLLVSATRQVRALRRLGIAGGGRVRASSPARAKARPPAPDRPEASKPPPAEPASGRRQRPCGQSRRKRLRTPSTQTPLTARLKPRRPRRNRSPQA